jgi:hypothetical protein
MTLWCSRTYYSTMGKASRENAVALWKASTKATVVTGLSHYAAPFGVKGFNGKGGGRRDTENRPLASVFSASLRSLDAEQAMRLRTRPSAHSRRPVSGGATSRDRSLPSRCRVMG